MPGDQELTMYHPINRKIVKHLFLPIIFCFCFVSIVAAQDQPEPILIQVNQLDIKPDKLEQFRSIHRDVFIPAARANGVPWRLTSTIALGNTLSTTVVSPIPNMAALDSQGGPASTELEGQLALNLWAQTVQARRSFIVTSRPDMSMAAQPQTGLTVVYRFRVTIGKIPQFVALWNEKVIPALETSNITGTRVFQTVSGGLIGEFYSLTPVANFATADGPGPFSGLEPQEAQALNMEMTALLDEMELTYNRVDQELSYGLAGTQQ
jgi:hypothetical protein